MLMYLLVMPQFSPSYSSLVFMFLWVGLVYVSAVLWWSSKRKYSF